MLPEKFCIKCIEPTNEDWKKFMDWLSGKNKYAPLSGDSIGAYYCSDGYVMYTVLHTNLYKLITLKQFFEMKEEKDFIPERGKKYYFTDHANAKLYGEDIRIFVAMSLDGEFIAQINETANPNKWKYCISIPEEEETLELTLEQIAEKFNVSVENLKIKKK